MYGEYDYWKDGINLWKHETDESGVILIRN